MIANLLANAIKYSPEGGSIEISAGRDRGFVRVEVRDHGLGIPETYRASVFTKFFRGEAAKHGIAGLGLGLAISRRASSRSLHMSGSPRGSWPTGSLGLSDLRGYESVKQAASEANCHRVSSGSGAQLRQDVVHVCLYRLLGKPQPLADLAVEEAVGHQAEDLELASSQLLEHTRQSRRLVLSPS